MNVEICIKSPSFKNIYTLSTEMMLSTDCYIKTVRARIPGDCGQIQLPFDTKSSESRKKLK